LASTRRTSGHSREASLSPADILRIVDLVLEDTRQRTGLVRRGMRLVVSRLAREHLARVGFHPTRGARPLRRAVEELVVTPLAVMLSAEPQLADLTLQVVTADEPPPRTGRSCCREGRDPAQSRHAYSPEMSTVTSRVCSAPSRGRENHPSLLPMLEEQSRPLEFFGEELLVGQGHLEHGPALRWLCR